MLAYVVNAGRGAGDALLGDVATDLLASGLPLAGVIQTNYVFDPERRCHMDLQVLGQDGTIRISQDRGRHARGCRLDPQGLADAVARAEAVLDTTTPALLIVNKFGKSEIDGEGFRDLIAKALLRDIPVLTAVSAGHVPGFLDFASGMATELPADKAAILTWCRDMGRGLAA